MMTLTRFILSILMLGRQTNKFVAKIIDILDTNRLLLALRL
jgi:hypothetical protein